MNSRRFRDLPIAAKLRVTIVAACFATVALSCLIFVTVEGSVFRRGAANALLVRANILAVNSSAALAFNSPGDATEILRALKTDPTTLSAAIFDEQGKLFAHYERVPGTPLPEALGTKAEVYRFDGKRLEGSVPVMVGNRAIGSLVVVRTLSDLAVRIHLYEGIAVGVMAVMSLAAYFLAGLLQRPIAEPVQALAGAAVSVAEKNDYSVRVPRTSADEIGKLVDAFNAMMGTIERHRAENRRLYDQIQKHATELERRVKERTAQLENANDELESFGSSVSHDLRGPVRYAEGFARAMLEDCGDRLPPEAQDYARKIIERMEGMHSLINSLLEVAHAGQRAIAAKQLDLAALCREIFEELRAENPDQNTRLEIEPVANCYADPVLCRQVLVNLLSNALKYSRNRAQAVIRFGQRPVAGEIGPAYYVTDNGVGFDMSRAGQLFSAFGRLESAQGFEGTGIGLTTVKRIVQRHGGRIWAESAPDAGATFYFTLPTA